MPTVRTLASIGCSTLTINTRRITWSYQRKCHDHITSFSKEHLHTVVVGVDTTKFKIIAGIKPAANTAHPTKRTSRQLGRFVDATTD